MFRQGVQYCCLLVKQYREMFLAILIGNVRTRHRWKVVMGLN